MILAVVRGMVGVGVGVNVGRVSLLSVVCQEKKAIC